MAVRVAYLPLKPYRTCRVPENEQTPYSFAHCVHVVDATAVAANNCVVASAPEAPPASGSSAVPPEPPPHAASRTAAHAHESADIENR